MTTGKWTEKEDELLRQLYLTTEDKELVSILNRTIPSIVQRRIKLNLTKKSKEKHTIKCFNCSKEFVVHNSRKEAQFCSRKCKGEYTKKNSGSIRNCIVCGKEFYAAGNPKTNHICSRECTFEYRKTGKLLKCDYCGKEVYKQTFALKKSKNFFCDQTCANKFQKGEMVQMTCKVCAKPFEVYPSDIKHSELRGQKIQYCSIECRNNDPDKLDFLIKLNDKQNKNKENNKLEQAGIDILNKMGLTFQEQYLVNNKISVDIYIEEQNLIIEWWGDYWHGHPTKIKNGQPDRRQKKRMALDISQKKYFDKCGFKVLTFWEHEVLNTPDIVEKQIKELIDNTNGQKKNRI